MSALWDYLSKEHGLTLVDSEIHDILELARQEIELPDEEEINDAFIEIFDNKDHRQGWHGGVEWALNKVRNPYPRIVRFTEDKEDFFKK